LHTADPSDAGSSEVSGGAYARQGPVTFANAGNNPTISSNSAIISYPVAGASWGTVTHFGIWDAATAGNFRGSGALNTPKLIGIGDTARFAANALTITAQ
jgi:hypothetical protein